MGPLSRLVGRPPFESPLTKDVLPLIVAANDPNGAISLTQTFNRILFYVCNIRYFPVQKAKNGDRGTIVFTAVLTPISFRCSRLVGPGKDFVAIWILVGLNNGMSP